MISKKILILTLITLILITGSALAFEDFAGDDWNDLNKKEKEIFLRGYQEGLNLGNYVWIQDIFEFTSHEEIYSYMKDNDRYIDVEDDRYLRMNKVFEKNPNGSLLEILGKGYTNLSDNVDSDIKENTVDSDNKVTVTGYDTKIFAEFEGEPYNRHGKLYVYFKNNNNKTLTGVIYNIKLYDNFGDLIIQDSRKNQIKINPQNTKAEYFVFTQHMSSNIYNLIANDTIKVEVNLKKAVFEDGSIINFN